MTREEVFERLNKVFQEVFDDETIEVNDDTTSEDIDAISALHIARVLQRISMTGILLNISI